MITVDIKYSNNPFYFGTTNSVLLRLIEKSNPNNKTINLIYAQLKSPYLYWNNSSNLVYSETCDIFAYLNVNQIKSLQNKEYFFCFDATAEGFSTLHDMPFFQILHDNCKKYNINPEQLIFASSNLLDENNYQIFVKQNNILQKLKILNINWFEDATLLPSEIKPFLQKDIHSLCSSWLDWCKNSVENNYTTKYFSSFSRVSRYHRARATFILSLSPLKDKALISHNSFRLALPEKLHFISGLNYTLNDLEKWLESLPYTIDRNDFSINWAGKPYTTLYHQTLFHIVNETHQDDFSGTSMFFSEKTFRPVVCLQPFIIYGQKNCHMYFEQLGYRLYKNQFDYSFDNENDISKRYYKILDNFTKICKKLDGMTRNQQIDWRFQDTETLFHNFKQFISRRYNQYIITNFISKNF